MTQIIGRPSTFTQETADTICTRLAEGESLRTICRDEAMPAQSTVFRWLSENTAFQEQYTRAREAQADAIADEILEISDDGSNDWMLKNSPGNTGWVENGEAIRRSQLRIDARKWLAGKMKPKKYGDKLEQTVQNPDGSAIMDPLAALMDAINNKSRTA